MKTTDQLIDDILRREGGFVDHPADRGGPTNFGITQATLSTWLGREATTDDVRDLAEGTARAIYAQNYLTDPGIDTLPATIIPFVFDAAVNHGPAKAIRMLQRVLGECGHDVTVDGVIGPQTRRACEEVQAALDADFLSRLIDHRRAFYQSIALNDPSQKVFLAGWLNRLAEFEQELVA
ncbi:MAG: glycosyl hydrolase 108 family protein [Pseudomonadota bacterium]